MKSPGIADSFAECVRVSEENTGGENSPADIRWVKMLYRQMQLPRFRAHGYLQYLCIPAVRKTNPGLECVIGDIAWNGPGIILSKHWVLVRPSFRHVGLRFLAKGRRMEMTDRRLITTTQKRTPP